MGVLGLGRENHLSELNDPLDTQEGVLSPSVRRARAQANLGVIVSAAATVGALKINQMPVPATATDTATLTAAQLLNGVIHGTPTAAAAYTLPLASDLAAALPTSVVIGDAFEFSIVNLATTVGFDITVTTNTGWTLAGPMVVGAGPNDGTEWKTGIFRARRTAAATFTLYRVG